MPNTLVLWDTSSGPVDNTDRAAKLGGGQAQAGVNISFWDQDSGRGAIADCYTGSDVSSIASLEPDNFVLQLHDGVDGPDNCWALRLSADHTNSSQLKQQRNTPVIDQEARQMWAELMDLFIVGDRQTPVADPELQFNDAGFLAMLPTGVDPLRDDVASVESTTPAGGNVTRGALALSIHRNLGHAADDQKIGQLAHMMVFLSPYPGNTASQGATSLPNGVGLVPTFHDPLGRNLTADQNATVAQGGIRNQIQLGPGGQILINGSPIGTVVTPPAAPAVTPPGNRPNQEDELGLRADTGIKFQEGLIGRLANDPPPSDPDESGSKIKLVRLYVSKEPGSPDDSLNTDEDSKSNHTDIPKPVGKQKILGWVKVPPPGDEHHDYSYHHPPPGSPSGSSSGGGSGGGGGGKPGGPAPGAPLPPGNPPSAPIDDPSAGPQGDLGQQLNGPSAPGGQQGGGGASGSNINTTPNPFGSGAPDGTPGGFPIGQNPGDTINGGQVGGSGYNPTLTNGTFDGDRLNTGNIGDRWSSPDGTYSLNQNGGPPDFTPTPTPGGNVSGLGVEGGGTTVVNQQTGGVNVTTITSRFGTVSTISADPSPAPQNTSQTQSGWVAPHSPGFTSRTNIYPHNTDLNIVGTIVRTKPIGCRNVQIRLWVAISDPPSLINETIALQVMVGAHVSGNTPSSFVTLACKLPVHEMTPYVYCPVDFFFPGFDPTEDETITILTVRLAVPQDGEDNSAAELMINKTEIYFPESRVPIAISFAA